MALMRLVLTSALVLSGFATAVAASEAADPFQGKTLDEIKKLLERRLEERKKDREFYESFKAFAGREEKKMSRLANSLAAKAWQLGEYMQAEYFFRFGQHAKSLEILNQLEKKVSKNRRTGRTILAPLHFLEAANYTYLDKPAEATSAMKRARESGAIGSTYNDVQKKLLEYGSQRAALQVLVRKRDLAPRGGDEPGANQWALCLHYGGSIFRPAEEWIELSWIIDSFPQNSKVKSGDAAWARVRCAEKLADFRETIQQAESFRRDFPAHYAVRQGDVLESMALAYFGLGSFKDAKRTLEDLIRLHPKHRFVESKRADALIRECENPPPSKDRFEAGNSWNLWWRW